MSPEPRGGARPGRVLTLATADATREFGVRLGRVLHAGDLVVLTGGLGAGKTTLAQGLGEGLGVRGPVTSPTFVIARVHPSLVGGPPLVHVDAYRLGGALELDDLDLDESLEQSVTVVEWGHGVVERLSGDRLEVVLRNVPSGDEVDAEAAGDDTERTATLGAVGQRWSTVEAQAVLDAVAQPSAAAG